MQTKKKVQIITVVFAMLVAICSAKPHIVMMMVDDLGWNDVGFHGSEISTPTIDALAASGVVLNNYYTAPNCGPSRAQFLTGKYLTHLGLQHGNLRPCIPRGIPLAETTIANELNQFGYKSHLIGKWHGGFHTSDYLPTNRGFDSFRGMLNGLGDHYTHKKGFQGTKFLDFYNDTVPYPNANGIYSSEYYSRRAHEVIDEHSASGDPMFMFLSFQAPHTPNQSPPEYKAQYAHITHGGRRKFAAMVTALDDAIASVVAKLSDANMIDNTVIIISTDNGGQALSGGASNYPLRGNKGNYYEAGIKGVALVSSPLLNRTGQMESLVHITDWMPTFIHLAGGSLSNRDGVNQWDAISAGASAVRREIIYDIDPVGSGAPASTFDTSFLSAIRSGDWKLMTGKIGFDAIIPNPKTDIDGYSSIEKFKKSSSAVRLFNIADDPSESNDMSEERPEIVLDLTKKLIAHQQTALPPFNPRKSQACEPQRFGNIFVWGPYLG